jgi:hypothetical protein
MKKYFLETNGRKGNVKRRPITTFWSEKNSNGLRVPGKTGAEEKAGEEMPGHNRLYTRLRTNFLGRRHFNSICITPNAREGRKKN